MFHSEALSGCPYRITLPSKKDGSVCQSRAKRIKKDRLSFLNPTLPDRFVKRLLKGHGAMQVSKELSSGTVVCILPDRGDRYLSTTLFKSICAKCPP